MRALPARRIATAALCAALLTGAAGPAAVAAGHDAARDVRHGDRAAAADSPELLRQARALGELGAVLQPSAELLDTALKAETGQLSAEQKTEVHRLAGEIRTALDGLSAAPAQQTPARPPAAATPDAPAVPLTPALPDGQAASGVPSVPGQAVPPAQDQQGEQGEQGWQDQQGRQDQQDQQAAKGAGVLLPQSPRAVKTPGDTKVRDRTSVISALLTAVDALVRAVAGDDATTVGKRSESVVKGLTDLVETTLLGSGSGSGASGSGTSGRPENPENAAPERQDGAAPGLPEGAAPGRQDSAARQAGQQASTLPATGLQRG
ncbi:hypothetical protein GCM10010358_17790 [Streptomyces minutiscleroticus]|uniref:Secreted protein n=1 Tax=Streptomyces minutiscleroticus TaxID=68238 RepID=A0A918KHF8_9ACTN|nr:hypothetical protein [Streptomyces minutiscleroticus]GGX64057.1 hypothetical protein GCM10010358_17790 [Streptomyces minutiscleroticus]